MNYKSCYFPVRYKFLIEIANQIRDILDEPKQKTWGFFLSSVSRIKLIMKSDQRNRRSVNNFQNIWQKWRNFIMKAKAMTICKEEDYVYKAGLCWCKSCHQPRLGHEIMKATSKRSSFPFHECKLYGEVVGHIIMPCLDYKFNARKNHVLVTTFRRVFLGGTSAVFGKSSLKYPRSFRFLLCNQKSHDHYTTIATSRHVT